MAEKSEKATPKKLRDARKKGQVAKSQDFPSAFTFMVSIAGALALSHSIYTSLSSYMVVMFRSIRDPSDFSTRIGGFLAQAFKLIFDTSIPLMVIVSAVGIFINLLIVGPLFSMEAMKPDIKRLNPISNLKNMFKVKTFVELIKSILKITIAMALIYSVIKDSLPEIIATCGMPVLASTIVFASFLKKVVIRVGIFFLIVSIFDLIFQKSNFQKEMKMEKFEVKQEYKDTEGDPHIKSRRKQIAQEIAYQEGPGAAKRAKAVVVNPTHIAVAIEYDAEKEPAPKVVTMGLDTVADEIIKIAVQNNIPVMRDVDLAQTLYYKGRIGDYVPEETYEAIAQVLKWIAKLEATAEEESALEIFKR